MMTGEAERAGPGRRADSVRSAMSPGAGRDSRRTFSRAEVRRVWERQGRVCALYGRAIPFDLMHGDHIHPWIAGGPTVFENWQALCGSCNLRKGSQPQAVAKQQFQIDRLTAGTAPLRAWQIEALDAVLPRVSRCSSKRALERARLTSVWRWPTDCCRRETKSSHRRRSHARNLRRLAGERVQRVEGSADDPLARPPFVESRQPHW